MIDSIELEEGPPFLGRALFLIVLLKKLVQFIPTTFTTSGIVEEYTL